MVDPASRMRVHVLELAALVKRMDSGPAKERVQARYEEAKHHYEQLTREKSQ